MRVMAESTFDFIIIGGGLAGQSLAWRLRQGPLRDSRIALIDLSPKTSNDRTWCYWEREPGPFDHLVFHRWDRLRFHGPRFSSTLDIAPYSYKMIRGEDFYRFMEKELKVERFYGRVKSWESGPEQVVVELEDGQTIAGRWGFSSLLRKPVDKERYHYLDQHFKGWVIRTEAPVFDPGSATFMDFRVPQDDGLSFLYALPFDEHSALVELTFFSNKLFSGEEYDRMLKDLIPRFVTESPYEVTHEEIGAIPMTDYPFPRAEGRVVFIGTAGGHTKASSGFTFWRLQKNIDAMVRQMEDTGKPFPLPRIAAARFSMLDSVMLRVLEDGKPSGAGLFESLFRKNPAVRVLKFLHEETRLSEELQLMGSLPLFPFLKAFMKEIWKKLARKFKTNAQF